MRASSPTVVLGGGLGGLGVARSLGAHGIPAIIADPSSTCPAVWSRHARYARVPALQGSTLVDALVAIADRIGGRPPLLVTDEVAVPTVSEARDRLALGFRMCLPPRDLVADLSDKAGFQDLATRHGLPVPRAVVIESSADIGALDALRPPIVLKPCSKVGVHAGSVDRINVASDLVEARALCTAQIGPARRLIAQEWVPGDERDILFLLFHITADGTPVASFAGRKLACSPPLVGSTAACCAAPGWRSALEALAFPFARAIGLVGTASLEFKRNAATGALVAIEPTVGRTDWQEEAATLCGVNIPVAAYRDAMGLPAPPREKPRDVVWRHSIHARLPAAEVSARRAVRDGYFRLDDPLPGLAYYAGALSRLARLHRHRRAPDVALPAAILDPSADKIV